MQRKAQISIEYLILTGFVLLMLVIPAVFFLSSLANKGVYGTVNTQKITDLGNGLVDSAKQMYYLGLYSKKIVDYDVPQNVEAMFLLEINKSGTLYYYVGVIIDDGKEQSKYLFPSRVPLMSETSSYVDYDAGITITDYVSECTPTDPCHFYSFKSSAIKPGKKNYKVETKYVSPTSTEVRVSISPLIG
jgi:Class III signal peptide